MLACENSACLAEVSLTDRFFTEISKIPRNPGRTEHVQTVCTRLFFLHPRTRAWEWGYIGYCLDDESRNCNELIVMVMIMSLQQHECSSNISVHTQNGSASQLLSHKKIVFWMSLQNGCTLFSKYIDVLSGITEAHNDYNTWCWNWKKNCGAHNDYNTWSWNWKKKFVEHTMTTCTIEKNCGALHWTISHQAVCSVFTLRAPLSTTCYLKKWLVHVGVLNPVWKIFIIVLKV